MKSSRVRRHTKKDHIVPRTRRLTPRENAGPRGLPASVTTRDEVRRERGHQGHVVWGEAGIGKSHLLARLYRWAQKDHRACCVFLHNIQPSPEAMPRYVVKCVVSQLTAGKEAGFYATTLYRLVGAAIGAALTEYPPAATPPSAKI